MLLQYIHIISPPHDAIYFVKCTIPSCRKAPPQHDAATPVLHGWDGVLRLASLPLFPPMVIMAKEFHFLFHQTRGHFFKKYDLCPHVQLQTVVWLFIGSLGAVASSLLSGLSGYVDIDTFVPVSSSIFTSFAPKYFQLWKTERVSFLSCMTAEWSHGVSTCPLLFVQMNVVPSDVWKLLSSTNQTCGGLQFFF
jgi:hypothetical protein